MAISRNNGRRKSARKPALTSAGNGDWAAKLAWRLAPAQWYLWFTITLLCKIIIMGSCCTCSFIFEVYYVMPILNCINISWEKEINMCHSLGTCKKGKSICYDYDTYNYINYEIRTSIRIIFLKSHPFNWAAMPAIFASWIPKGDRQSSSQPTQRPRDGGMI